MTGPIRIGTRKSPLALWQAEHVKSMLLARDPSRAVQIVGMSTEGDRRLSAPLANVGGKGLFIKELEQALLDGDADVAVHSMKDVPGDLHEEFTIDVVGERGDVRDALVGAANILDLPADARIGSSSTRRAAQLLHHNRQFEIVPVRGNVQTRLRKLDEGEVDALMLATAGLERLGLSARIGQRLDTQLCLPAAGQGALGVEYCSNRDDVAEMVASIRLDDVASMVQAERAVVTGIAGDCTMPLGVLCQRDGSQFVLETALFAPAGERCLRVRLSGSDAAEIGTQAAQQLLDLGAAELLEEIAEGK